MSIRGKLIAASMVAVAVFSLATALVLASVSSLPELARRMSHDHAVSRQAVELEHGARRVLHGAWLATLGHQYRPLGMELIREGRQTTDSALGALSTSVYDEDLAAELGDLTAIAHEAEAAAVAVVELNDPDGGANRTAVGVLVARVQALALKVELFAALTSELLESSRQAVVAAGDHIVWVTAASTTLAVILALVLSFAVAGHISRRVRTLAAAAERLGDGDLSIRVAPGGGDEVAELGRSFDRMGERLVAARRQLVEAERLAAVGEVAVAVKHEVSNPLQGVLSGLEVVLSDAELPTQLRETLAEIRRDADRIRTTMLKLAAIKTTATRSYVGDTQMLDLDQMDSEDTGPG